MVIESTEEFIPREYKTLYVYPPRKLLEKEDEEIEDFLSFFYERLLLYYTDRGRLQVLSSPDPADIHVMLFLSSYKKVPWEYDSFNQPVSFRWFVEFYVDVRINPKKHPPGKYLLQQEEVRYDVVYPFERKEDLSSLFLEMADPLSMRVVYLTYEGWYSELKTPEELGYDPRNKRAIPFLEEEEERVERKHLSKEEREKLRKREEISR